MEQGVEIESRISKSGTTREQKGAELGRDKDAEHHGSLTGDRTISLDWSQHVQNCRFPSPQVGGGGGVQEEGMEASYMDVAKAPKGV